MKILVVCQHYWPEPYPLPDICEEIVKRGHTVHLIADVPNYPMGITYPEYKNKQRRHEVHNGVEITRTFTIERKQGALFRLLNYYSGLDAVSAANGRYCFVPTTHKVTLGEIVDLLDQF